MGIKTITITWLLIQLVISSSDWKQVVRGVFIPHDTDNRQLVIKTNSKVGSNEAVRVWFYSQQTDDFAGAFVIKFTSPPEYEIYWCSGYIPLLAHLPYEEENVWNITKTVEPRAIVITCNDVEVVNMLLSNNSCYAHSSDWDKYWSKHVTRIMFGSVDTASDYYISSPVIHGGWSDYGDWTECSADCDGGTQTRTRICNNPAPANGCKECEGEVTEHQSCNTNLCPAEGYEDKNTLWLVIILTVVLFLTTVLSIGYILYLHRIKKAHTSKTEIMLSDKTAIIEAAA